MAPKSRMNRHRPALRLLREYNPTRLRQIVPCAFSNRAFEESYATDRSDLRKLTSPLLIIAAVKMLLIAGSGDVRFRLGDNGSQFARSLNVLLAVRVRNLCNSTISRCQS